MTNKPDIVTAMREADWDDLMPKLIAYAAMRLRHVGWLNGEDREASAASVLDVVNNAIAGALSGSRDWQNSSAADLEQFLCGVIKSQVSTAKRTTVRSKTFASADPIEHIKKDDLAAQEHTDHVAVDDAWSAIGNAIAECVDGDADLEALYLTVVSDDGPTKREAIAKALQWTADRVSAARVKLRRRLLKTFPEVFGRYAKRRTS